MQNTLPDEKELYRALTERDPRYEQDAFVCVTSTGIFCRLTCPARKPKPENCVFMPSVKACLEAGYRACKRCRPMQSRVEHDTLVRTLLDALEDDPQVRWSEEKVEALGFDPSTVRRRFLQQFDMTFLQLARQRRLLASFNQLANRGRVIDAQHESGFESASAFRVAFARLLGCAPKDLARKGRLAAYWIPTPLGDMIAVSDEHFLHLLEFADRRALPTELTKLRKKYQGDIGIGEYAPTRQVRKELDAYFAGKSARFDTPLYLHGSEFTQGVWQQLCKIPAGTTISYAELANRIGNPSASRAVARANGANQLALVIPCHRVIAADGSLSGYGGGVWRKQRLIEIEQQYCVV